jgi:hypothetical protein
MKSKKQPSSGSDVGTATPDSGNIGMEVGVSVGAGEGCGPGSCVTGVSVGGNVGVSVGVGMGVSVGDGMGVGVSVGVGVIPAVTGVVCVRPQRLRSKSKVTALIISFGRETGFIFPPLCAGNKF